MKRLFLILLFLPAFALAACGGSKDPDLAGVPVEAQSTRQITVEAKDIAFAPASIDVVTGQTIQLTLQNTGMLVHDFSVLEIAVEGNEEDKAPADHEHTMTVEPELHVAAAGGASSTLVFMAIQPGVYEFFCSVPGHKEAGMVGTLVVNET